MTLYSAIIKSGIGVRETLIPTLASQGIDKNLAKRARRLAAMPETEFEAAHISPSKHARSRLLALLQARTVFQNLERKAPLRRPYRLRSKYQRYAEDRLSTLEIDGVRQQKDHSSSAIVSTVKTVVVEMTLC